MSVTARVTTADKNLQEAKKHIKQAVKLLSTLVLDECSGTDEYTGEYLEELEDMMVLLNRNLRKIY